MIINITLMSEKCYSYTIPDNAGDQMGFNNRLNFSQAEGHYSEVQL